MNIQSIKLVYFSPTGTSESIIKGIDSGINHNKKEFINITKPEARKENLQLSQNQLLIVAFPVYAGGVPELVAKWIKNIEANNTPTVCVSVYGNRGYDGALIELKNIMKAQGCIPIAHAAFIGEHSFTCSEKSHNIARPDAKDLEQANLFGQNISKKLNSISSVSKISDITLPGDYICTNKKKNLKIDFISVSPECSECGICFKKCPVGAIEKNNYSIVDKEKCIVCCACIKSCPIKVRTIKDGLIKDSAKKLHQFYKERKEPEFFL